MRVLAIILLVCIVFLSAFGGVIKPAQTKMAACCKKEKTACKHAPAEKKKTDNACNEQGCAMMFLCAQCGCIVKEAVALAPIHAQLLPKPVALQIIGNIAAYHANNWKPPQTC
ncbi:MAG: hypothetical protein ABI367_05625 [Mucilaginibacter sp.]